MKSLCFNKEQLRVSKTIIWMSLFSKHLLQLFLNHVLPSLCWKLHCYIYENSIEAVNFMMINNWEKDIIFLFSLIKLRSKARKLKVSSVGIIDVCLCHNELVLLSFPVTILKGIRWKRWMFQLERRFAQSNSLKSTSLSDARIRYQLCRTQFGKCYFWSW